GPRRAKNEPDGMTSETSSTAVNSPNRLVIPTSSRSRSGSATSVPDRRLELLAVLGLLVAVEGAEHLHLRERRVVREDQRVADEVGLDRRDRLLRPLHRADVGDVRR